MTHEDSSKPLFSFPHIDLGERVGHAAGTKAAGSPSRDLSRYQEGFMRFIHTSDWHLGQTLKGFDRYAEHQVFLDWLLDTLEDREADALLIAGDIFDQANPSAEAQSQYYRFLSAARRRRPDLDIVVIAGNHDSAGRLDAPRSLLRAFGVGVVGHYHLREALTEALLDRLLIPLHDRYGDIAAWTLALPFMRLGDLRDGESRDYIGGLREAYARLAAAASARCANGAALIAMGHLHAHGGVVSEDSERRLVIGGEEAVDASIFPPEAAYVALGHLHLPQAVGGRDHIRYSGSPLPLSFSEIDYPHQVLQVELDEGRARISSLRTPRAAELLRIPARPKPLDDAIAELETQAFAASEYGLEPLLEVQVCEAIVPTDMRARIEAAIEGKPVRLAGIQRTRPAPSERAQGDESLTAGADLRRLDPLDLFQRRLDEAGELADRQALLDAFAELLDEYRQEAGR